MYGCVCVRRLQYLPLLCRVFAILIQQCDESWLIANRVINAVVLKIELIMPAGVLVATMIVKFVQSSVCISQYQVRDDGA